MKIPYYTKLSSRILFIIVNRNNSQKMSREFWMVDMTQFILWSTPGKLSDLKASFKYMTKKLDI